MRNSRELSHMWWLSEKVAFSYGEASWNKFIIAEWQFVQFSQLFFFFSSYNVWKYVRYPALISFQPAVITEFRYLKAVLLLLALPSSFCHRTGYLKELYIYIYIYARSIKSKDYIGRSSSFSVNSLWCYYAFTITVSWCYVITQEWWFRVYYLHAENFLAFDQIQLDAHCAVVWRRFEATFKQRPVIHIFERNEMTECPRKP